MAKRGLIVHRDFYRQDAGSMFSESFRNIMPALGNAASQIPRVKIHELYRAAGVAQAERATRRHIRRQREALRLFVVALHGCFPTSQGDDETLITTRRRAVELEFRTSAINTSQLDRRQRRYFPFGGFCCATIQHKLRIAEFFFCPQHGLRIWLASFERDSAAAALPA